MTKRRRSQDASAASSPITRRTKSARSSPRSWSSSASARISAARRSYKSGRGQGRFGTDWHGGFYCPCHGSMFDLAGRVYKNKPAPDNLDGAAVQVRERHEDRHRRRHQGSVTRWPRAEKQPCHRRGTVQRLLTWVDSALPADIAVGRAVGQVLRAEELQLLVLLRLARDARAGDADRHRHLPHDELQARRGEGVRVGRVHHARRAGGAGSSATCIRPARRCSSSSSTCTCSAGCMYG